MHVSSVFNLLSKTTKQLWFVVVFLEIIYGTIPAYAQTQPSIQTAAPMQSLGAPVNTLNYSEFSPTLSADGNTMIFESDREGKNRWRLYITYQTQPGVWSNPTEFKVVNDFINGGEFLGGPCLSYDGTILLFTSNKQGTVGGIDIWYTQKKGDTWTPPKNMGRGVNTSGYDGFPSLSADGKYLYFMREGKKDSPTGQRCCSLYVAERRGGFYINARPLPLPINTGCEGYPRIMADGKTLIFSSYRDGGKGGYDLYESKLKNGRWSKPIPLNFINTAKDDELISVTATGEWLYLSNTSSNNKDDIYRVELPKEFRPDEIVTVEGTIRDTETNKIINATVKVNNIKTKEIFTEVQNNEVTGKYTLYLAKGEQYDFSVSSEGKTFHSEVIKVDSVGKVLNFKKDVKLKTLRANASFTLNNIFFGFDSSVIKKESELELERTLELLTHYPNMNVEISAHTDDKGSDAYNIKLSQARADAVVKYLTDKGIAKERLIAKGYGKAKPCVPNDSDENRAKNRRVEFKILKF